MIYYLVNGKKLDPNGNEIKEQPKPKTELKSIADFPEAVQASLKAKGLETPEAVKAYGKDELVKLDGIGEATADKLLALE